MSIPLNPIIISSTTSISVALKQTAAARALKVSNKSSFDLQLTGFGGFGSRWLASGVEDLLIDQGESSGQLSINAFNTANLQNPPSGACLITVYLKDEPLPVGNWPVSIPSQVVNSVSNTTSIVENDGNPAGTVFVGSIVTGDGTNKSVSITNDGVVIIGDVANPGSLTLGGPAVLNGALTAKGLIVLAAAGLLTHVLGTLTVDQAATLSSTLNVSGLTTLGDISVGGSTLDQIINAPTGKVVRVRNNGTDILTIDGTNVGLAGSFGFALNTNGVFRYRNGGTTQAWGNFTGTGSGTYNHGFGSSPFAVIPIVNVVGSATQGYDTITSTQVHITLGAVLGFRATMWS